jgi:hypothetical protein
MSGCIPHIKPDATKAASLVEDYRHFLLWEQCLTVIMICMLILIALWGLESRSLHRPQYRQRSRGLDHLSDGEGHFTVANPKEEAPVRLRTVLSIFLLILGALIIFMLSTYYGRQAFQLKGT